LKGGIVQNCYFAADVESSRGDVLPPENNMVSFALCEVGNPCSFFYTELQLLFPRWWDWHTEEIHRITREYLRRNGKDPWTEMEAVSKWVRAIANGRQAIFCAMPVWFDYGHLNWYFRHFGMPSPFAGTLDGRDQYRAIHGLPAGTKVNRMDVWREFPTSVPHTHHALSDVFEYEEVVAGMLRAQHLI
jgi:hypothetical protein